jgi:hypothetical protein
MSRKRIGRTAARALVLVALLQGAIVQAAIASRHDTTPTPTAVPTATAESTPTPTPTPVNESVAQITALSIIDDDGDVTTRGDRNAFDGQWEFDGDFGNAELLDSDPTSDLLEPAFWTIAFTEETQVLIIDRVQDGYRLIDVECVATDNPDEWAREDTSVIWLVPFPADRPVGFDCQFIHATGFDPIGSSIEVDKFIDPDADPSTPGFDFPSTPVEFRIELDAATVVAADPFAVDGEAASWAITYTAPSSRVVVTEVPQDGFELMRVTCFDIWADEVVPSTLNGNSVSFEAMAPTDDASGFYGCNFVNVRTGAAAPRITLPPTDVPARSARDAVPGGIPFALLMIGSFGFVLALTVRRARVG